MSSVVAEAVKLHVAHRNPPQISEPQRRKFILVSTHNAHSTAFRNSGAAAERTLRLMGKISSCDPSIEWCIVKDGGGNVNVATVAAKMALMSTMAQQ
jgi:hypothetical protein